MAADQGDTNAIYNLGVMFINGQGVPQNYEKTFELFTRAAYKGSPQAAYGLGILYAKGWGTPVDDIKAYAWFKIASETPTSDKQNKYLATFEKAKTLLPKKQIKEAETVAEQLKKDINIHTH